jgi:hypothetical protein
MTERNYLSLVNTMQTKEILRNNRKQLLEARSNRNTLYFIDLLTYKRNPDTEFQSGSSYRIHNKSRKGRFIVFPTYEYIVWFCSQIIPCTLS